MIVRVSLPGEDQAREFTFHRAEAVIGSGRRTDLCIQAPGVGLRHARLHRKADRVWLEPLRAGTPLVIDRAQVGRIKATQAIPLLPGDVIVLSEAPERATVELVAVQDEQVGDPEARTLLRLGDRLDEAGGPLLVATARLAAAAARAGSWEELRTALGEQLAVALGARPGCVGLAVLGTAEEPPQRLLPEALEERLASRGALASGPGWRGALGARLARGDVLLVGGGETSSAASSGRDSGLWPRVQTSPGSTEMQRQAVVMVPLRGEDDLLGFWAFSLGEASDAGRIAPVAAAVSDVLAGALLRLERERERRALREEIDYFRRRERRNYLFKELVTHSPAMKAVYDEVKQLVHGSRVVWILGEQGTGKEMVARALHHLSERADALMISQSCAALEEVDLDAELFGRAAESPAGDGPRPGLLELTRGGTLFLEEIDRLPLSLQAKLLRAIQEREVRPAGASVGRSVDVGVVASSERDLFSLVQSGAFRKDLYLLLARQTIHLPALRERRQDIVPLAQVFLATLAPRYRRTARRFSPEVGAALEAYHWPGNVRELQGYIEAAVIAAPPDVEVIERVPGLAG